jgi:P27 family predicted phage terminase small subunit
MPSGGSNLKSNSLKKAHGTYRADRDHTKKPVAATPATEPAKKFDARMPSFLDSQARSCWRRTLKEAGARLRNEDYDALTSMCVHFSLWQQSVAKLQAEGPVIVFKGVSKRNPLVQVVSEYQRTYLAASKYLGIGDAGYRNRSTQTPEEAMGAMDDHTLQEQLNLAREREGVEDDEEA